MFTGPLWVSQKLGEVKYRLARFDAGKDVGVFHVMNVQSFYSWIFFFWVVSSSKQGPRGDGCGRLALDPSGWRHKPLSPALPDGEAFVSAGRS